jgi:hypothetical protein
VNQRIVKKVHKTVDRMTDYKMNDMIRSLMKSPWYTRLWYAIKLLFKLDMKVRFGKIKKSGVKSGK